MVEQEDELEEKEWSNFEEDYFSLREEEEERGHAGR